ncbi:hypothetical protein [Streptomyces celluloflavus]|uniref:hypothetical protein n=1 Tax=Streptomyces celluloflavus TaxID=58344 RepID=UPI003685FB07
MAEAAGISFRRWRSNRFDRRWRRRMTAQQAEAPVAQGIDSSTRHGRDSSAMMSVFADPHREFALAATKERPGRRPRTRQVRRTARSADREHLGFGGARSPGDL